MHTSFKTQVDFLLTDLRHVGARLLLLKEAEKQAGDEVEKEEKGKKGSPRQAALVKWRMQLAVPQDVAASVVPQFIV